MIFWLKDKSPIKIISLLKIVFPDLKKQQIKKIIHKGKVLLNDEPVFDVDVLVYENDEVKYHGEFIKLKRKKNHEESDKLDIIKHKPYIKKQWDEFSEAKLLEIDLERLSIKLHNLFLKTTKTISVAESCTGGMLQEIITRNSGSSKYFQGGVVTYSLVSKEKLLKVKKQTLKKFGAVSYETAKEMVYGLKQLFETDVCISITGIAGPTGGTKEKPVGTVFYSIIFDNLYLQNKLSLEGKREAIRKKTTIEVMKNLIKLLEKESED